MKDHDQGSSSLELVLMAPVLVALVLFVVFVGRVAQARSDVDRASRDAARAASIARTSASAIESGESAARETLSDADVACESLRVDIDVDGFGPGGDVTASVTCSLNLSGVSLLRLPGSRTITASFSESVDTYRGIGS